MRTRKVHAEQHFNQCRFRYTVVEFDLVTELIWPQRTALASWVGDQVLLPCRQAAAKAAATTLATDCVALHRARQAAVLDLTMFVLVH